MWEDSGSYDIAEMIPAMTAAVVLMEKERERGRNMEMEGKRWIMRKILDNECMIMIKYMYKKLRAENRSRISHLLILFIFSK